MERLLGYVDERLKNILDYPKMWGDSGQQIMQFILLLETQFKARNLDATEKDIRKAIRDKYAKLVETTHEDAPYGLMVDESLRLPQDLTTELLRTFWTEVQNA